MLLLDTHVLLWWLDEPALLPATAREAIPDPANDESVSAAVAWEFAVKRRPGKLAAPDDLISALAACNFQPLPVRVAHALATEELPAYPRDPFDRLLVALAKLENGTLVSRDPNWPGTA